MTMHLSNADMAATLLAHLWQCSAFVAAAWLLACAMSRYPARARFWVWMCASIKFLVPFAWLASLGARWAKPQSAPIAVYTIIEEFSQPFGKGIPSASGPSLATHALLASSRIAGTLASVWLCGCVVIMVRWAWQWRSAHRIVKNARLLHEGPEVVALRSVESEAGVRRQIPVVLTSMATEPGIFGIMRPILVWPAGLTEQLTAAHIEAIIAHEMEHVRRRDNLTAAVHACVEALFWFHPAVFWIGSRIREERELACDECVIAHSIQAQDYAESILKVCAFCLEPPVPCVAGVSGSDLKKRVLRILRHPSDVTLTRRRRALLAAIALLAIALPVSIGVVHGQVSSSSAEGSGSADGNDLPKFDVVSVKPGGSDVGPSFFRLNPDGTSIHNIPLPFLLREAFGTESDRLIGVPSWAASKRYDIEAKVAPEDAPNLVMLKAEDRRAMLIPLLIERFNLKYHHETRELPMYTLIVARGGAKLTSAANPATDAKPPFDGTPSKGIDTRGRMMMAPGRIESQATSIDMLAHALAPQLGRSVVDKTGLTGRYDYTLKWAPDNAPPPMMGAPGGPAQVEAASDAASVPLFTALQEQLGLKLESEKSSVDVIVIDHIDLPSAN
jgi:uncharacterized protein (TIGR03435 family)